ncbi:SOS response-associated peptidase [Tessaracoccus sp. OS52]|uniref:SOS response-associated peptidase n=1 Tax=Tessaracoccus sp. OS52 TaxID=2886691 RepID=UPI001D11A75B|nr:SOS response-associated peptidase [Tessaracoccus sp. OS52]MCC2593082.1 SOS response-associated peptidase [Tessaracoccus sp. OS52]
MCGRYAATANPDELIETYDISLVTDDGLEACAPRYNIAPTDVVPAVVERVDGGEPVRKLVGLRWGLVPSWSKDASGAARMINARSETVASKPAFRKAFAARRCILPAIGYYEWRAEEEGGRAVKQPYFLHPEKSPTLSMAGIYEFWKGPDGWLPTVSIITTSATDETGWVHDRMPMTVGDVDAWLDPTLEDVERVHGLLSPITDLVPRKVSRAVNTVGNDGPGLVEPVG